MYDIIIIGAGPAGITAAIYARRANKSVLLIDKGSFGGQMTFSPKIENYPAYAEISGSELADKMLSQALDLGTDAEVDTIECIEIHEGIKTVRGKNNIYTARAVIVATGAEHRRLGIEHENECIGNGISFCAVCDGAFYKDKSVLLIGGGNSAMQEALLLSDSCRNLTIIQNLPYLTGEAVLREKIENRSNITVMYNSKVKSIIAKGGIFEGIVVESEQGETKLYADGMFIAIGLEPQNKQFENVLTLDEGGYADSGEDCFTKTEGIFVAGDCRKKTVRQISTAVADGASSAVAACKYLK